MVFDLVIKLLVHVSVSSCIQSRIWRTVNVLNIRGMHRRLSDRVARQLITVAHCTSSVVDVASVAVRKNDAPTCKFKRNKQIRISLFKF